MEAPAVSSVATSLFWFRRDLRLDDNPGLSAALSCSQTVIPVFIWSPDDEGEFQPGTCSRWWLSHSLADLDDNLASLGSRLLVRRANDSLSGLADLLADTGASAVFFNQLYDPISLVRDFGLKQALGERGIACWSYGGDVLFEPWEVLQDDGQPFITFESFWNKVRNSGREPKFPLPPLVSMPYVPRGLPSLELNELGLLSPEEEATSKSLEQKWEPGARASHKQLEKFVRSRLSNFCHQKAQVDKDSTSELSPYIHYGEISVRYIYYRVKQEVLSGSCGQKSSNDFLKQMGYREYSRYISFHFPFTHERAHLEHLQACPWRYDKDDFKAWRLGLTGYPMVDAGMRQLWSEGWQHNRLRVVCASFLVKNLLLPWQWGLKYFWRTLLDADLECDALGWQYISGCLADAHPFGYLMELEYESRKFDASGRYIRRWIPSLARLPNKYIHCPWAAPAAILEDAGVELGVTYPHRLVKTEDVRHRVLDACNVIEQSQRSINRGPFRPATAPAPRNDETTMTTEQSDRVSEDSPEDEGSDMDESTSSEESGVESFVGSRNAPSENVARTAASYCMAAGERGASSIFQRKGFAGGAP